MLNTRGIFDSHGKSRLYADAGTHHSHYSIAVGSSDLPTCDSGPSKLGSRSAVESNQTAFAHRGLCGALCAEFDR